MFKCLPCFRLPSVPGIYLSIRIIRDFLCISTGTSIAVFRHFTGRSPPTSRLLPDHDCAHTCMHACIACTCLQWPVSLRMLRVTRTDSDAVNDDADSIVSELERELVFFYDERGETHKARGVNQLLNEHPAEHIAVSLAQKYGIAALPPSWATTQSHLNLRRSCVASTA